MDVMELSKESNFSEGLSLASLYLRQSYQEEYLREYDDSHVTVTENDALCVDLAVITSDRRREMVEMDNMLSKSDDILIVQGKRGCGKSAFLNSYLLKWAKSEILTDIALLFRIRCRETYVGDDVHSVEDLLKRLYPSVFDMISVEELQNNSEKVLIVFDDIDELDSTSHLVKQGKRRAWLRFPYNLLHTSYKTVVTCQVETTQGLLSQYGEDKLIKIIDISGFSSKKVETYVETFFHGDECLANAVKSRIKESETLITQSALPLYTWTICTLLQEDQNVELPKTITGLNTYAILLLICDHLRNSKDAALGSVVGLSIQEMIQHDVVLDIIYCLATVAKMSFTSVGAFMLTKELEKYNSVLTLVENNLIYKLTFPGNKIMYKFKQSLSQEYFASMYLYCCSSKVLEKLKQVPFARCLPTIAGMYGIETSETSNLLTIFMNIIKQFCYKKLKSRHHITTQRERSFSILRYMENCLEKHLCGFYVELDDTCTDVLSALLEYQGNFSSKFLQKIANDRVSLENVISHNDIRNVMHFLSKVNGDTLRGIFVNKLQYKIIPENFLQLLKKFLTTHKRKNTKSLDIRKGKAIELRAKTTETEGILKKTVCVCLSNEDNANKAENVLVYLADAVDEIYIDYSLGDLYYKVVQRLIQNKGKVHIDIPKSIKDAVQKEMTQVTPGHLHMLFDKYFVENPQEQLYTTVVFRSGEFLAVNLMAENGSDLTLDICIPDNIAVAIFEEIFETRLIRINNIMVSFALDKIYHSIKSQVKESNNKVRTINLPSDLYQRETAVSLTQIEMLLDAPLNLKRTQQCTTTAEFHLGKVLAITIQEEYEQKCISSVHYCISLPEQFTECLSQSRSLFINLLPLLDRIILDISLCNMYPHWKSIIKECGVTNDKITIGNVPDDLQNQLVTSTKLEMIVDEVLLYRNTNNEMTKYRLKLKSDQDLFKISCNRYTSDDEAKNSFQPDIASVPESDTKMTESVSRKSAPVSNGALSNVGQPNNRLFQQNMYIQDIQICFPAHQIEAMWEYVLKPNLDLFYVIELDLSLYQGYQYIQSVSDKKSWMEKIAIVGMPTTYSKICAEQLNMIIDGLLCYSKEDEKSLVSLELNSGEEFAIEVKSNNVNHSGMQVTSLHLFLPNNEDDDYYKLALLYPFKMVDEIVLNYTLNKTYYTVKDIIESDVNFPRKVKCFELTNVIQWNVVDMETVTDMLVDSMPVSFLTFVNEFDMTHAHEPPQGAGMLVNKVLSMRVEHDMHSLHCQNRHVNRLVNCLTQFTDYDLSGDKDIQADALQALSNAIINKEIKTDRKDVLRFRNCCINETQLETLEPCLKYINEFDLTGNNDLSINSMSLIADAVRENSLDNSKCNLRILRLGNCNLTDSHITNLQPCIDGLHEIDLTGNYKLSPRAMKTLSQSINYTSYLQVLRLVDCCLRDQFIKILEPSLIYLSELDLSRNLRLSPSCVQVISKTVSKAYKDGIQCNLKALYLAQCDLNDLHIQILKPCITFLHEIDLSENGKLSPISTKHISNSVTATVLNVNSNLKCLRLRSCKLGNHDIKNIIPCVKGLSTLDLSSNHKISPQSIKSLSEAIVQSISNNKKNNVRCLRLADCSIRLAHIEKLQPCLKYLQELDLSQNHNISPSLLKVISISVTEAFCGIYQPHIEILKLADCTLTDTHIQSLQPCWIYLHEFDLSGNCKLTPEAMKRIADVVERRTETCCLKTLHLRRCDLNEKHMSNLNSCTRYLHKIDIGENPKLLEKYMNIMLRVFSTNTVATRL